MAIKIDMDLQAKVKLARRVEMHFVFCPGSKLEEHYLALSKRKLTKSDHAEARLESDGTKIYFGIVRPDAGSIVFLCKTDVPSSARKALEKTIRQKAGLSSIDPRFRTTGDIDDADSDDNEERRGLSMNMRKLYAHKEAVLKGVKGLRRRIPPPQAKKVGRAVLQQLNAQIVLAEEANAQDDEATVQQVVRGLEKLEQQLRSAGRGGDPVAAATGKTAPARKGDEKPFDERVTQAKSRLREVEGYGEVPTKVVDQLSRLLDAAQARARKDEQFATKLIDRFEKESEAALSRVRR